MIVTAEPVLRDLVRTVALLSEAWGLAPVELVGDAVVAPDVEIVLDPVVVADLAQPGGREPRPAPADERYVLDRSSPPRIVLRVAGAEGAFRGLVALLRPGADDRADDDAVVPALRWRGLALDVARHFLSVGELERVVDLLAYHHLNVLHLHLSDSQAWRLESLAWPRLVDETSGAYYSRVELAGLTAYAAQRFVTLIPEIDLPGHVQAAIRAYPELEGDQPPPHPALGHLRPGVPVARRFVEDVVDELAEVSTSPYLHVGGDEAFGMDPDEYAEMARTVQQRVRDRGRLPLGWQEGSRSGDVRPDQVLQWWISPTDVPSAAQLEAVVPEEFRPLLPLFAATFHEAPGDVPRAIAGEAGLLLSPSNPCYLDRRYAESSTDPAQDRRLTELGHPGYPPLPTRQVQAWHPGLLGPVQDQGVDVAGLEAALWAESVTSFDDLALLLLPRLSALAAVAWDGSPAPWETWAVQTRRDAPVWDALGLSNHFRSADIYPQTDEGTTR